MGTCKRKLIVADSFMSHSLNNIYRHGVHHLFGIGVIPNRGNAMHVTKMVSGSVPTCGNPEAGQVPDNQGRASATERQSGTDFMQLLWCKQETFLWHTPKELQHPQSAPAVAHIFLMPTSYNNSGATLSRCDQD